MPGDAETGPIKIPEAVRVTGTFITRATAREPSTWMRPSGKRVIVGKIDRDLRTVQTSEFMIFETTANEEITQR